MTDKYDGYPNKDVMYFADDVRLLVAYPGHVYQPIVDIANAVYGAFFDFGIDVEMQPVSSAEALNTLAQQGTYSHILSVNTHDYLKPNELFYLDKPKITKLMSYNLEQTPIEGQNSYWASMRLNEVGVYGPYFDYIVSESTFKDHDILNMGFRILNLNLPYHPSLDPKVTPKMEEKEFDVLFIGCGCERRDRLVKNLSKEGITFAPVPMPHSLNSVYKSQVIQKTKLCVNIHFSDMEYFEKPRMFYDYFMNKATVVSEKLLYPEVFEHLKDLYMAKYVNLEPMIHLLLSKYGNEMLEMGERAYNKFKEEYHYEKLIPQFFTQLYEKEQLTRRRK